MGIDTIFDKFGNDVSHLVEQGSVDFDPNDHEGNIKKLVSPFDISDYEPLRIIILP